MAEQSSWSREGMRLLAQEHKIRLVLTVLLAAFVTLAHDALTEPGFARLAVLLMVAALVVSRYGAREARVASAQQFHISAVVLAVLDLVAVTLLLRGTGGANSGFFSLYLISLIFAAVFFRGLELGLLTIIATFFYIAVCLTSVTSLNDAWHVAARLIGLIVVAWYSYALSGVLRREKEARDQLLRHLTEGVLVFDANGRVTLINQTMLLLLGGRDEFDVMGKPRSALAALDNLTAWIVCDVGATTSPEEFTTRVGCFPEANLPLVECTTIPCGTEKQLDGWVVVCKDLRDQTAETRVSRRSAFEKLSPLSNLRALSQALYGMAEYLEERQRWLAVENIQRHTRALQGLLADLLHNTYETESEDSEVGFVEIPTLLQGTRRLLEIAPAGISVPVEIVCQDSLPDLSADRGALGQSLLQICKALVNCARTEDHLVIDVRASGERMVFTVQLVSMDPQRPGEPPSAAGAPPCPFDAAEALETITQHGGTYEYAPEGGVVRRVVFDLPIEGTRKAHEDTPEQAATRRELAEIAAANMKLDPALAAEVSNQLKNALNVIRGYAELALTGQSEERRERALRLAIDLSDQASELVDSLQPAGGQFSHEPLPLAAAEPEVCEVSEETPSPTAVKREKGLILVVDDDTFMRQLLIDMLDDAGYETAQAADGCEALEFLQGTRPAMVFVDLAMPRMTGVDVLRETKKTVPDLPIVLMTGYAYNLAMEALGDEKPYAVIGKPFAIAEVLSLAKSVVGEARK